jgi:(hydroxyamino)benzene mutase
MRRIEGGSRNHDGEKVGIGFIFYSSFDGFAIPIFASTRIGLSVHTLSALQGIFLLALGLLWPNLKLGVAGSWTAFWLFIYGAASILAAYTLAAIWGVGIETIALMGELPHGLAHGTVLQETVIKVLAYSSALTGLTSFAFILWGLRGASERPGRRDLFGTSSTVYRQFHRRRDGHSVGWAQSPGSAAIIAPGSASSPSPSHCHR